MFFDLDLTLAYAVCTPQLNSHTASEIEQVQLNYLAVAKCAMHAYGEFNLATPNELFSYEAKRNNLALNFSSKFS